MVFFSVLLQSWAKTEVKNSNTTNQANHGVPLSPKGRQGDESCRMMRISSCWERNPEQRTGGLFPTLYLAFHTSVPHIGAEVAANSSENQVLRKQGHEELPSLRQEQGGNSAAVCQALFLLLYTGKQMDCSLHSALFHRNFKGWITFILTGEE